VLLLVVFIPDHVRLWSIFPVWYHMTFLVTLVPLVVLGSWLARPRTSSKPVPDDANRVGQKSVGDTGS
jgi:hypothetical protein